MPINLSEDVKDVLLTTVELAVVCEPSTKTYLSKEL